jgi:tetratricopeptide (TPR) repeat protein
MAWLYEPQAYKYLQAAALRLPAAQTYALHLADTLQSLLPYKIWTEIYEPLIQVHLLRYLQSEITQLIKARSSSDPLLQAAENTLNYARTLQERFPFAEPLALEQISDLLLKSEKDNHHTQGFLYASQYVALVKSIGPPDAEEREKLADKLNNMAWHIYEHLNDPVALWVAIAWTKDALSYKPDAWHIWDTLGALYYKLKRKKEAITALSKAIEIAKSQKIPETQYQETEELLQKAQDLE